MNRLWWLLLAVFGFGALGGLVNSFMTENGIFFPSSTVVDGTSFLRPGIFGNLMISGVAAAISWGLYGPFATAYLIGGPDDAPTNPKPGVTLASVVAAVLVGMSGARWLTNEIDKEMLRTAAAIASSKTTTPTSAAALSNISPQETLRLVAAIPAFSTPVTRTVPITAAPPEDGPPILNAPPPPAKP